MPTNPLLLEVPALMETARLVLRPPRAGDGEVLFQAVSETLPELRQFIASVPWVAAEQSVENSEIYCRLAQSNFVARKDFPYLLFDRASSQLVGCVGLHRPDWSVPKMEVGYWCRTSHTGNGYITEAIAALVQMAQDVFCPVRLDLVTDEANAASRAVADRSGFALEGILRNERRAPDGQLRNTCIYARTFSTR